MSEPKVNFELHNVEDRPIREMFDQFRRWHEFREDNGYPSLKTFTGSLSHQQEVLLYVDGLVYGYTGMTQNQTLNLWTPMFYSVGVINGQCYFSLELDNEFGNYVKVRCQNTTNNRSLIYRVTLFYRDA